MVKEIRVLIVLKWKIINDNILWILYTNKNIDFIYGVIIFNNKVRIDIRIWLTKSQIIINNDLILIIIFLLSIFIN